MLRQKETKKTPRLAFIAMMAAGAAVVLVFTLTPWNFIPTQITEDVTVLGITEHGCVGESQYGVSVVVPNCNAQVGDVVSATFYVSSMEFSGYYDKLQDRVDKIFKHFSTFTFDNFFQTLPNLINFFLKRISDVTFHF